MSVRGTTQPSHISFSSSCAGIAAAAGELAKDQRHQDAVEEAGCDFVQLVVETFGVWSPFSLQTLRTIAERTTAYPYVILSSKASRLPTVVVALSLRL